MDTLPDFDIGDDMLDLGLVDVAVPNIDKMSNPEEASRSHARPGGPSSISEALLESLPFTQSQLTPLNHLPTPRQHLYEHQKQKICTQSTTGKETM